LIILKKIKPVRSQNAGATGDLTGFLQAIIQLLPKGQQ